MGVLEDAIREHLELRRRHGVSDDELRRQEDEALGAARREAPLAEAARGNEAETGAETALLEPEEAPASAAEPAAPALKEDQPAAEETPVEDVPFEHPEAGPAEPAPPFVESAPAVTEPEPAPDFAEERPEQDALPFEERPRRDLDFD